MTAYVLLPAWVMRTIRTERSLHLPNETGGFLIGIRRGPHIEVTSLTRQGPLDRASGISFERLCPSHRDQIHAAWERSGGIESLVGDWHSHPHGTADASGVDHSAWRTLVRTSSRPMLGLVDAGCATPNLYFAAAWLRSFAVELGLADQDAGHLIFAAPEVDETKRPVTRTLFWRGIGGAAR